jgi:hypothetical protein
LLCGIALALATWFLLGPIGGFHHSYAFGVLIYMLWDGDGPSDPNVPHVFGFDVFFSPARFTVSALAWLLVAGLATAPLFVSHRRRTGPSWKVEQRLGGE